MELVELVEFVPKYSSTRHHCDERGGEITVLIGHFRSAAHSACAPLGPKCNIAVKTPVGISELFELNKIEMQGT